MNTRTIEFDPVTHKVREVLAKHGRLSQDPVTLDDDASLNEAGMTSHASVNVMLALEAEFGEIPDRMLTRSVFQSIASITRAMRALQGL
ncbi:MAG: acyl carrier protein [Proteobacteria bacterium]|nr:acyl carrier protein [Pseudomonadota bacterium]